MMDENRTKNHPNAYLYPQIDPFNQMMMDVGDGHHIYVEQCGRADGLPVIVLHGGPGGGCSAAMRRYFDPKRYRIVLFDQRGCGRSRPYASISDNTTWHLVADMERIRKTLGIETWICFGGSWGATLALVYALTHPNRIHALVLRGVFLMTKAELDWFYGGGAGRFWPELWERFIAPIPQDERHDMIAAYRHRLFSKDQAIETRYGQIWGAWENALTAMRGGDVSDMPGAYARAFARIENHYFSHGGWLESDGWILAQMDRIAHLPGVIVQGRYDMICPPAGAHALVNAWPKAVLKMVPDAGHALSEPGISVELVRQMDRLAAQ